MISKKFCPICDRKMSATNPVICQDDELITALEVIYVCLSSDHKVEEKEVYML